MGPAQKRGCPDGPRRRCTYGLINRLNVARAAAYPHCASARERVVVPLTSPRPPGDVGAITPRPHLLAANPLLPLAPVGRDTGKSMRPKTCRRCSQDCRHTLFAMPTRRKSCGRVIELTSFRSHSETTEAAADRRQPVLRAPYRRHLTTAPRPPRSIAMEHE